MFSTSRQEPDLLLLHAPSVYDFRERAILYGPVSDMVPSSTVFEMYPLGFLTIASYLHDRGLLRVALRVADFVASHLPAGDIPLWDYDAPAGAPVDVSAGVITAAGLFHLAHACEAMTGVCSGDPGPPIFGAGCHWAFSSCVENPLTPEWARMLGSEAGKPKQSGSMYSELALPKSWRK